VLFIWPDINQTLVPLKTMSLTQTANATTNRYRIPLLLTLIAAGLIGNYLKYPLFLNIDFLFGSIFTMLALQFLGLSRGVLASVIIASYTYIIWNHPYAIIIQAAEVVVVGWLMQRHNKGMVLADTLYWLIIGMPLVYLFYHNAMHVPPSNTYIVMIKQAVNGIANALVARLIFTSIALQSRSSLISLSDIIYSLLAFFVLFPALIILAISSRSDFNETDNNVRATLIHGNRNVTEHFENWLLNRKASIVNLAEQATSKSPQEMQSSLEQAKKSDANYQRIALVDKDTISLASAPLVDETGKSAIGISFTKYLYGPDLQQTNKPILSEVIKGEAGFLSPTVLVIEPVVINGQYAGYVAGALNLDQIREHLNKSLAMDGLIYTLVDKNSNVIMTNRSDQSSMAPEKGTLERLDNRISRWVPVVPPNTPISERWKRSFYVTESTIGNLAEWKLILEQPVAPFQKRLHDSYTGKLTLLFLILLGALALAEFLSHRSFATLEKLSLITRDLPLKLTTDGEEIAWPESSIKETHYLVDNFKDMGKSLSAQFVEIRQINQTLEQRMEELRESEARFKALHNASFGGIAIHDEGIILDCNQGLSEITGYSTDELIGMNGLLLISEKTRDLVMSNILSGYEKPYEALGVRKNSEEYPLRLEARNIPYKGRNVRTVEFRDITDLKQAEEERKILQAQLIQAQKMEAIGTLAGGIAHDFNNILGAVIGYAEMAQDASPSGSTAAKDLGKVLEAGHRAASLVKQILAFSRQVASERIPLVPSHMVKEAIKLLRPTLPSTISIKQQLESSTKSIFADPTQIHQIVMNLCTNAFHAMEQTGGTLEISLSDRELTQKDLQHQPQVHPGKFVVLSISDSGPGIPLNIREKIFDPYFTTKEVGKGTGMGLAIVHGIVTTSGGFITCESEMGKGTVFHIFFPAIEQNVASVAQPVENVQTGKERILLIDDEDMLVDMGKAMLERLGYEVTVRTSSLEALSTFQNQPDQFDVVITDQTMPGMTGMDLAKRMLQIRPDIPIILCTGYSNLINDAQAKSYGIKGFAMKPMTKKDITTLLREVLEDRLPA